MKSKTSFYILIATAILIVILASLFASSHPDGLEFVAVKMGLVDKANTVSSKGALSTILSGVAGVLLCLSSVFLIKLTMRQKKD